MKLHPRVAALALAGTLLLALGAFIWTLSRKSLRDGGAQVVLTSGDEQRPGAAPLVLPPAPVRDDLSGGETPPEADEQATESHAPSATPPSSSPPLLATPEIVSALPDSATLLIPVAGVRPEDLLNNFSEERAEGRTHNAIDIPAPRGTPVLAAADGRILRLFQSERGGLTIYQLSADERMVFYYAHLDRYADGLAAGHFVRRGQVIAYVGDTGNAGAGNYHLHFAVWLVTDPRRYWDGASVNPYPLLGGR